jgi:hypothetical protein
VECVSLSRPADPSVAKARGDRFESDPLGFKSVDRDGVEDKSWVRLPYRQPDEPSAGVDCDPTAERIGRLSGCVTDLAPRLVCRTLNARRRRWLAARGRFYAQRAFGLPNGRRQKHALFF